jgi:hypothetical protein
LNKKRNECHDCGNNYSSNVNVDVYINSMDDGKKYNNSVKKNDNEVNNSYGDDKDVMVVICLNESNEVNEKENKSKRKTKKNKKYNTNKKSNTNIRVLNLRNAKTPIKHSKKLRHSKIPKHKINKDIFTIKTSTSKSFQLPTTTAKFIITTTS